MGWVKKTKKLYLSICCMRGVMEISKSTDFGGGGATILFSPAVEVVRPRSQKVPFLEPCCGKKEPTNQNIFA